MAAYLEVAGGKELPILTKALEFVIGNHTHPNAVISFLNLLAAWALATGKTDTHIRTTASYHTIGAPAMVRFLDLIIEALGQELHPQSLIIGHNLTPLPVIPAIATVKAHVGNHPALPSAVKGCLALFPLPQVDTDAAGGPLSLFSVPLNESWLGWLNCLAEIFTSG